MKPVLLLVLAASAILGADAKLTPGVPTKAPKGWIMMFNGKSLDGWKATERPENWTVEDGSIVGRGERTHLFWMKQECVDCEFKADIKLNNRGNSGMFFRSKFMEGWPEGYEAQVNNSGRDPVKTGSLYNIVKILEQLVQDDTWWTQHIIVKGNHITIRVNDKEVVNHTDEKKLHSKGYLGIQQHDPGSVVHYRNLMMKPLK